MFVYLLIHQYACAQTHWSFELQFGVVHSLDLPLTIKQQGFPDIKIPKADFYSEPLLSPPYWSWRFSKWFKNKSIEFETIHHKFYLRNKPAEVQRFGISHGYNMIFMNHSRKFKGVILRAGAGSALVHPESTIRGMAYPEGLGFDIKGYRLRGISLNLAAAKQINISKHFFINTEAKINGAVANIPVVNGHARVHIIVFQLIVGPGVNFAAKR